MYVPHLPYPFISQWTFRFLPCPGSCKYSCSEHWGCMCLFELLFSQVIWPIVGLLVYMIIVFSVFKGTSILFFTVAVPIYIFTYSPRGFSFLYTLSCICYCGIFMMAILTCVEWWLYCRFDLHFSNISNVDHLFRCFWISVHSLKNVYVDILPIFLIGLFSFFLYWAIWAVCTFWRLIPCCHFIWWYFSYFEGCLLSCLWFLGYAETLTFN